MNIITYVGGCGRLGLSLAVWSAYKGFKVIIADVDEDAVRKVNQGISPISEMGVDKILPGVRTNLYATTNIRAATAVADATFIIVPTPSNANGSFSLKYITAAIDGGVAEGIRDSRISCPLVVVVSTVNPGDTRKIAGLIEEGSGKAYFEEFYVAYSPEFIRQGTTMRDFSNPDLVLIGSDGPIATSRLREYYGAIVDNNPGYHLLTPESAEIAKIAINAYLGMKIHFAAQIMWLCQYNEFSSAHEVLNAVGADSRIGRKFLKPGLWPGGPCLPRDNRALSRAIWNTDKKMLPKSLAEAADHMVFEQAWSLCELLEEYPGSVGVLGLTYKTGVDITEESPGVRLAKELKRRWSRKVYAYDPATTVTGLTHALSLEHAVELCDVLVITTPWQAFKSLEDFEIPDKTIVDCWGILRPEHVSAKYIRLGEP